MNQPRAKLRTCGKCEWIFHSDFTPSGEPCATNTDCPKCGFASYGAQHVYQRQANKFYFTQEPWLQKQLAAAEAKLRKEHIEPHEEVMRRCGNLTPRPVNRGAQTYREYDSVKDAASDIVTTMRQQVADKEGVPVECVIFKGTRPEGNMLMGDFTILKPKDHD